MATFGSRMIRPEDIVRRQFPIKMCSFRSTFRKAPFPAATILSLSHARAFAALPASAPGRLIGAYGVRQTLIAKLSL